MAISQGVFKQTRFKRQTAKGTLAGATGGQILRRETSTFELAKETYTTESEINSAQQLTSSRHGVKTVNGSISGIFSPATYADPLSAVLRRDFTAVAASTGVSVTIAGTGPSYTVTRAAGSYLTDGFRVGQVIRLSVGALNANNINKNLLITGLTATVATVIPVNGTVLTAEGPITGTTITAPGKVTYAPQTGHTNIYYTVEEWMPDVPASERNQDVKFGSVDLSLPGSGNAKISLSAVGLDQSASTTAYFTAPTTETTTQSLVAATGLLLIGGTQQAVVTDLSIKINGNENPADGVVGSTVRPDIFRGKVKVDGTFTAYFDGVTIADNFRNETSVTIISVLAAGLGNTADFVTITLGQVDVNSSTPNDGETGLKRTFNFVAELNTTTAGGLEATTIQVQDSAAP